jgi:capsular polysaccharide transport system ATP-binding protein
MITLLDVSFVINERGAAPEMLFDSVTAHFPAYERVGILAAPGSGKTTLARLITGMLPPSGGHILRDGKVSTPMGYLAAMHPELTVEQNISIICRAKGDDRLDALMLATSLGRLASLMDAPLKDLNAKDKRTLGFCVSLASLNDMYVADDSLIFGEEESREEAAAVLEACLEAAGLIFISSNQAQLRKRCDRFYVLRNSRLEECLDLDEAAEDLKAERLHSARQLHTPDDKLPRKMFGWF